MDKGSYMSKSILQEAKVVQIWYVERVKTWRALSLKGVQKLTCQGSTRCNGELMDAFASAWRGWELFLCAKHVMWDGYEMHRKYFGWAETYG